MPHLSRNGKLALDKLKQNYQKWNRTGLSGYLVLGSNGEAVYLTEREKMKVIEVSRKCISSSKIMMVGTGMESTQETIRVTNQAAKLGADFALVGVPCYFKSSMKPQVLYDHFVAVADASKIGILLYNVTQFTGINMEADLAARLSEHPNIVGAKDSTGNIGQLTEIVRLSKKGFAVFVGAAPVLFPTLLRGGRGRDPGRGKRGPRSVREDPEPFREERFRQTRQLQNRLTPLAAAVTTKHGIGGLKMAMDTVESYFGGEPRLPLKRPGKEVEAELKGLLYQIRE